MFLMFCNPRVLAHMRVFTVPLAFFLLLEECLHELDEILRDKKDDILMFIILKKYKKTCRNV